LDLVFFNQLFLGVSLQLAGRAVITRFLQLRKTTAKELKHAIPSLTQIELHTLIFIYFQL
jgi:hypothetical protein